MGSVKILAENKKAYFDYEIFEKFEAGISLLGQEVKSIRARMVNLEGTFVILKGNEAFWVGAKIPPWQPANAPGYREERDRKLLLRKSEITALFGRVKQKGLTLIPLRIYTKGKWIKMEIGLAKKRKKVSKKEILKKRAIEMEIKRTLKEYRG